MAAGLIMSLAGCGPLPKGEFVRGTYLHLDRPRYSFEVPDGWRAATAADYPTLGFNRRAFAGLDAAGRRTAIQRAELELENLDIGLISPQGAWIQVASEALSERDKQTVWQRFSAARIERAPATDKPKLTLESMDVVSYGVNRVLRVRFRSDEARGALHWTVLGFYDSGSSILLAHVGTPENREEGLPALEAIAASLRLD